MSLSELVTGFIAASDKRMKEATAAATKQFNESELKLKQQEAQQRASETQQRLEQERQRIAIEGQYAKISEATEKDRKQHQDAQDTLAKQKTANAQELGLGRLAAADKGLDIRRQKIYTDAYEKAFDKARASGANFEEALEIAKGQGEFVLQMGNTKSIDPSAQISPDFIHHLAGTLSPNAAGVLPGVQGKLDAQQSLTRQREAQTAEIKSLTDRNKETLTKMKVDEDLDRARSVLLRTQSAAALQKMREDAQKFPLQLTELALKDSLHRLEIEEKQGKIDADAAMSGFPPTAQLRSPTYLKANRTALQTRMDKIGKAQTEQAGIVEKLYEHAHTLTHAIDSVPLDRETGQIPTPGSPQYKDYQDWQRASGPGGLYQQNLVQAQARLKRETQRLGDLNAQYDQLRAAATGPNGWIQQTQTSGAPDRPATRAVHKAATAQSHQSERQAKRLQPKAVKPNGGLTPKTNKATDLKHRSSDDLLKELLK